MSNTGAYSSKTDKPDSVRVIHFEDLLNDGLVLEDISRSADSAFQVEYYQASERIQTILKRNQMRHHYDGRHNQCGCSPQESDAEPLFNTIPFIGPRGSGKTSAMLSFQKMLTGYSDNCNEYSNLVFSKQRVSFLSLQYIDVSTLKSTEDVLSIILARMLQLLMKEEESLRSNQKHFHETEELRSLYQLFDRIYGNLLHLEGDRDRNSGESSVKMLRDLSSSYSIARDFRNLMRRYLEFFKCCGRCRRDDCYLVIALDDVDLYCYRNYKTAHSTEDRDAYTLLERVYEYLMIPGVIVLMTYNEDVLQIVCENHIVNKLGVPRTKARYLQSQFLEKIVPGFQKVYMPNFQRADNPGLNRLMIELPDIAEAQSEEKYAAIRGVFQYNVKRRIDVKCFLLNYIASVYNVYFDANGQKPHFFDKKNLRELRDFFKIISGGTTCNTVHENKPLFSNDNEWRYMRMTSYLNNQFARELLDTQEMELFEYWSKLPISRRSTSILDYIRKLLDNIRIYGDIPPMKINEMRNELSAEDHGYQYSYGELLYKLYQSTRIEKGLSKRMIYCLLATYSFSLTYKYENYLQNCSKPDPIADEGYQTLKSVLGSSIAGKRANSILHTEFEYGDFLKHPATNEKYKRSSQAGSVHFRNLDKRFNELSLTLEIEDKQKLEQSLQRIEMICMFFTDVQGGIVDYGKGFRFIIGENGILSTEATEACFNILNFAANSFMWREFFDSLHADLCKAIMHHSDSCKAIVRLSSESVSEKETDKIVLQVIREVSLVKKYKDNAKSKKSADVRSICPLPIHQFDMMYNIVKREADETLSHTLPHKAPVEQYGAMCWRVYENLIHALHEQDKFFFMIPNRTKFEEIFCACPFIAEMKKVYENSPVEQENKLNQYMIKLGTIVADTLATSTRQDELQRIIRMPQ